MSFPSDFAQILLTRVCSMRLVVLSFQANKYTDTAVCISIPSFDNIEKHWCLLTGYAPSFRVAVAA
ncbi:hypothetical protein FHK02_2300 [Spirosoma sp. LMG 31448]|uniref:Uncharacterized protein n=1 Tax=Spirosoma utsteinense TaxID=2585773 RepID=A0ABR6W5Y2_9BACT|nr:hypothetical protein [Spirosoma utsteinense]MBC3791992.1 hypothetical protein [Spirosoma utsteinense]